MNIYVGNLSYNATESDLRDAFEAYGDVSSARIIMDRATGKSKGFGFVEMSNDAEGKAAIGGLDGKDLKGRPLRVNESLPKDDGPRGGGGGGRGGYGGGGGGYGGGGRSY
ncbi:MAG: RNA-binding protein [FCB group bacterium]|nr:RNA-binding protein [FCB group bacterium]